MKKAISYAVLSSVGVAAFVAAPVDLVNAEATVVKEGIYDIANNKYVTFPQFRALERTDKVALISNPDNYIVAGGLAIKSSLIPTATDAELRAAAVPVGDVEGIDWADFEDKVDLAIGEVDVAQENGVAIVTAEVAGAKDGTLATVTITPDAMYTAEVIAKYEEDNGLPPGSVNELLSQEVAVQDGKVVADLTPLLAIPGTHTVTVAIGNVNSSADFTVEAEEAPGELVVESVMAINQTINLDKDQTLTFKVNGDTEVTAQQLIEQGYTVQFFFNRTFLDTVSTEDKEKATKQGVVNASLPPFNTNFKYSVQVTDAEGNKFPENPTTAANFADVTVVNVLAVADVTKVGLSLDLDYVTMTDKDKEAGIVYFKATETINKLGDVIDSNNDNYEAPKVESVTSKTPLIAYVDNENKIVPRNTGSATFEVEFKLDGKTVKKEVTVEVKAGQVATSIIGEDQKLAAETDETPVKIDVIDQYGEKLRTTITDNLVVNVNDKKTTYTSTTAGEIAISLGSKAGTNLVVVKKGEKTLGTVSIEFVTVTGVDTYKVVEDKKDEKLDIETVDKAPTKTYTIEGSFGDVKLSPTRLASELKEIEKDIELKSSDDKVATVTRVGEKLTVTGVKAGTSTITLVKKEGQLTETLLTFDVTVTSSVAQITELSLKEDTKLISVENKFTHGNVAEHLTAGKVDFTESMIANLDFVQGNTLIVTLKAEHGGKEFAFPAELLVTEFKSGEKYEGNYTLANDGTYGPETGTATIKGDVTVTGDPVTLQNLVIEGNLIIDSTGTVNLKNVDVKGETDDKGNIIVENVGDNSLILEDTKAKSLDVRDSDGARIESKGANVSIPKVSISSRQDDTTKATGNFTLEGNFGTGSTIVVDRAIPSLRIATTSPVTVNKEVTEVSVSTVDATVTLNANVTTVSVTKNATISTKGTATITKIQAPTNVTVTPGVGTATLPTVEVVAGPTLTNPGIDANGEAVTVVIDDNNFIKFTVDADQSYDLTGFELDVPSGASTVTVATDIADVEDVTFKVADLPKIADVITLLVTSLDRESSSVTGNGLGKLNDKTVTVTDSRGFSTTFTFEVTVTPAE